MGSKKNERVCYCVCVCVCVREIEKKREKKRERERRCEYVHLIACDQCYVVKEGHVKSFDIFH